MYCDELDACFFYGADGAACMAYSGITRAGSDDANNNIVRAFHTAKIVLDRMQELAETAGLTKKDKESQHHEENVPHKQPGKAKRTASTAKKR